MIRVNVKPLSANALWKGKRYKTDQYNIYRDKVLFILPRLDVPEVPYHLLLKVGLSNPAQDLDNTIKAVQDCLQIKYRFDDKDIYKITAEKIIVPKGKEYFEFKLLPYGVDNK